MSVYTLLVANLLTSTELDKLTRSTLAKLRPLSLVQRETVIRAILEEHDRTRRRSPSSPIAFALRRDGVM